MKWSPRADRVDSCWVERREGTAGLMGARRENTEAGYTGTAAVAAVEGQLTSSVAALMRTAVDVVVVVVVGRCG